MPGTYDEVKSILRSPKYGWSVLEAPAPDPVNEALKTKTPEEVAAQLEEFVYSQCDTTISPYPSQESSSTIMRRRLFTEDCKWWVLNTAQALGQQPLDPPVDTIGGALTVQDWWDHQEILRTRLGEKLCSAEEFARRNAAADNIPLEWIGMNVDPLVWQLLVREGYPPTRVQSYFGLAAQQVLDNLWHAGTWLPTKAAK